MISTAEAHVSLSQIAARRFRAPTSAASRLATRHAPLHVGPKRLEPATGASASRGVVKVNVKGAKRRSVPEGLAGVYIAGC